MFWMCGGAVKQAVLTSHLSYSLCFSILSEIKHELPCLAQLAHQSFPSLPGNAGNWTWDFVLNTCAVQTHDLWPFSFHLKVRKQCYMIKRYRNSLGTHMAVDVKNIYCAHEFHQSIKSSTCGSSKKHSPWI